MENDMDEEVEEGFKEMGVVTFITIGIVLVVVAIAVWG